MKSLNTIKSRKKNEKYKLLIIVEKIDMYKPSFCL